MPRKKETAPGGKTKKSKNKEAVKAPKTVTEVETDTNIGTTEAKKTQEVAVEGINEETVVKLEDEVVEVDSKLEELADKEDKEELEIKEPVLKISVTREGRPGIFLPELGSLIDWINSKNFESIHHAFAVNHISLGANWSVEQVIERIKVGEKVAVLMKDTAINNMGHALAVIYENKLNIMDIGVITEEDLDIKD